MKLNHFALNHANPHFHSRSAAAERTAQQVPADKAWHRIATLAVNTAADLRVDVVSVSGEVELRLTRAALSGESHIPVITDFSKPNPAVLLFTTSTEDPTPPASPIAGQVASDAFSPTAVQSFAMNLAPSLGAEIGIEVRAIKGKPHVKVYGGTHTVG